MINIKNIRFGHGKTSSAGLLSIDNIPFGFIIEDEPRIVKVDGETRIPAGRRKLGIRKEDTPLTLKCRKLPGYKGWFKYFIEVLNVPGFSGIYFHILNRENETEGCQGLNYQCEVVNGEFEGSLSTAANKAFYEKVYPLLEAGQDVFYEIIDKDNG